MERRFISAALAPVTLEKRGTDYPYAVGYAAVFYRADDAGTQYQLSDYDQGIVERIMPWAFDRAIREKDDCRACFNHDANLLLGRLGAGTLELATDKTGLRYAVRLPDTQCGRDCKELLARGDVTGSSFSFAIEKQKWTEQKGGPTIRELHSLRLYDVGPVTFPAYSATTAGMRDDAARAAWLVCAAEAAKAPWAAAAAQEAIESLKEWRHIRDQSDARLRAIKAQVEARARCVELGL